MDALGCKVRLCFECGKQRVTGGALENLGFATSSWATKSPGNYLKLLHPVSVNGPLVPPCSLETHAEREQLFAQQVEATAPRSLEKLRRTSIILSVSSV